MDQQGRLARKPRRDRGVRLMTLRDKDVLSWVAEQYAVRFDHIQLLLGQRRSSTRFVSSQEKLSVSSALQVVNRWGEEPAWAEYKRFYVGSPGWVWASPYGIEVLSAEGSIPDYSRHSPRESTLDHLYAINAVRLDVQTRHPEYRWVSERTLRRMYGRRLEKEELMHLPDGQLWLPNRQAIAIEVELSPKSPPEYDQILDELLVSGVQMPDGTPFCYRAVWYFVSSNNSVRLQAKTLVHDARQRLLSNVQSQMQIIEIEKVKRYDAIAVTSPDPARIQQA